MSLPQNQDKEVELLPQRTAVCGLPQNLKPDDRPLFDHELNTRLPSTRLLELHDVSISSDGFLFRGMRILPESFPFPFLQDEWKTRSVWKFLTVNYLFHKRRRFDADALFITDDWSTGYFHWLSDVLPKLCLVEDRLKDLVVILPHKLEQFEFVRSSLEAFGVENAQFINEQESVVCRRLFVVTSVAPSGRYDEQITRRVRDRLVKFFGGSSDPHGLTYLSRAKARKRRIANEPAVIELLKNYGFQIINGEDYSLEQQVKIASATSCFVSNHGAGLTNIMFMNPGAGVLELRHHADQTNNCYFSLASAAGLNYYYQTCQPAVAGEDPHTADLLVDIETLERNVKEILSPAGAESAI